MAMKNPTHPGRVVRTMCLEEMWLSLQLAFDLAAAYRRAGTIRVKRFKAVAAVSAVA
jgi:plasmid maintenance system antidote protein VapI